MSTLPTLPQLPSLGGLGTAANAVTSGLGTAANAVIGGVESGVAAPAKAVAGVGESTILRIVMILTGLALVIVGLVQFKTVSRGISKGVDVARKGAEGAAVLSA